MDERVRQLGDLTIDGATGDVWVNGRALDLSALEFRLLEFLASRPSGTVSRDELIRALWTDDSPGNGRKLNLLVYRLRRKLEGTSSWRVRAMRRRGYMLCPAVEDA
ncbi:MAG TPA: winged helix-turn-helix domain-containing protein [Dehalococcoidia bacterium]|nr:winged helix-turn-helix domain-containing protein [Dehalococcoidia bacterium]